MGLFASRPQEPFEWAGLPSEPLAPKTEAEFLTDPPVDPFAITSQGSAASIAIVVPVPGDDPDTPGGSDPDAGS